MRLGTEYGNGMSVHCIRLKGPWEYEWLASHDGSSAEDVAGTPREPVGRVQMPCQWLTIFGPRAGRARFTRVFHCPTGLEPGDIVRLVFAGVGGGVEVRLNDEPLAPSSADGTQAESGNQPSAGAPLQVVCDITTRLRPVNRLVVEVEFDPRVQAESPGGLYEPVTIEITSVSATTRK